MDSSRVKALAGIITEAKSIEHGLLLADHRNLDDEVVTDLKKLLKQLGLYTYEAPATQGTDMVGIVISKYPLSKRDLKDNYDVRDE